MAIFTQLTSTTLFIISMAIAITNGMNTNSSSSECKQYRGMIQHASGMENMPGWKQNTDEVDKQFILKSGLTKLDSVTLNINDQPPCKASSSQSGKCKIYGDFHNGELIFDIAKMKVIVPFQNASFFSGNKCEIEIGKYDSNSHKLTLKINGADFEIKQTSATESVPCRRV